MQKRTSSTPVRPQPDAAATSTPLPLLGGLTAQQFMRRHWQKKPLLVRAAVAMDTPLLDRGTLFALAAEQDVESRLVQHDAATGRWQLRQGPFKRSALPPLNRPGWTVLVQGVDTHVEAGHALLSQFRFVPDARLDDLMLSYASDGGGVGPHFDSYDVFLLQVQGRRRWRIGRLSDPALQPDLPLKILANFEAEEEWVLEPGDMLYLPPRWAHDGVAEGECITASVGFRAASRAEFGREVLQRLLDAAADEEEDLGPQVHAGPRYRDPQQAATTQPGAVPAAMLAFASGAVQALVNDPPALARALGEWLSEPKPRTWFEEGLPLPPGQGVRLDRRTRMLWDPHHVFINGESYRAAGRDARLMQQLADRRQLAAAELLRLSPDARGLLDDWAEAGWLHPV